jgi:hypothetical protein
MSDPQTPPAETPPAEPSVSSQPAAVVQPTGQDDPFVDDKGELTEAGVRQAQSGLPGWTGVVEEAPPAEPPPAT